MCATANNGDWRAINLYFVDDNSRQLDIQVLVPNLPDLFYQNTEHHQYGNNNFENRRGGIGRKAEKAEGGQN